MARLAAAASGPARGDLPGWPRTPDADRRRPAARRRPARWPARGPVQIPLGERHVAGRRLQPAHQQPAGDVVAGRTDLAQSAPDTGRSAVPSPSTTQVQPKWLAIVPPRPGPCTAHQPKAASTLPVRRGRSPGTRVPVLRTCSLAPGSPVGPTSRHARRTQPASTGLPADPRQQPDAVEQPVAQLARALLLDLHQ